MKQPALLSLAAILVSTLSCNSDAGEAPNETSAAEQRVRLMTLDPGHFHAALVQKYAYDQVDDTVHVYAPNGKDLETYLALVEQFNTRPENPTQWILGVHRGEDYLEQMLAEKPGNVMVVAGNNARKIEYVRRAVQEGIHVLADKPMIIYPESFSLLKETLESADERGLLVNDIMTERHEITSILQRELSQQQALFGQLVEGSLDEPAISKESVHHFHKTVAGEPLIRPAWFFDVDQQGEGIVDVSTHLVDLILWQAFPGQPIDYEDPNDGVEVLRARSWNTRLTPSQFGQVTGATTYPDYLMDTLESDSILNVASNGEFVFRARGVHGRVSVTWEFENPEGTDTHYSIMRGTKADLVVRQDAAQNYRPTLYVESIGEVDQEEIGSVIRGALDGLGDRYPGLSAEMTEFGWEIKIPDEYREGHEEHFTRVTEQYLKSFADGEMPEWERTNLLTKYYITTRAYELSREQFGSSRSAMHLVSTPIARRTRSVGLHLFNVARS